MPDATAPSVEPLYDRVMLKISGEALMGDQGFGLHPPTVERSRARLRRFMIWAWKSAW